MICLRLIATHFYASFEAFKMVIFQVEVFWVVTQCSVMAGPLKLW
jgi:hypothetical protein